MSFPCDSGLSGYGQLGDSTGSVISSNEVFTENRKALMEISSSLLLDNLFVLPPYHQSSDILLLVLQEGGQKIHYCRLPQSPLFPHHGLTI